MVLNKEHSSPPSCTNGDSAATGEWSARLTRNPGLPGSSSSSGSSFDHFQILGHACK